ncbi:uncharacterized protein FIBRA_07676 [Fibroporia radiculosa]|uniref:Cytochrome P450 n=1 Tax=Fibroporia radiculosa TaxID=599839 RepID=J4IBY2_9APHY|nr:uncharacterized protein FIBRA_07676 [Fibroporia radiculosa]CCM05456.1 predicted protein [Fibroporia radiculosa]
MINTFFLPALLAQNWDVFVVPIPWAPPDTSDSVGNLLDILPHLADMLSYFSKLHSQYGDLVTFTLPGFGRTIIIDRPEWLEHVRKNDMVVYGKGERTLVMFTAFLGGWSPFGAEGMRWKTSRKVIKPIFASAQFDATLRAMNEILMPARELLSNAAKQDVVIDFNEFFGRLLVMIFYKMALSSDIALLTPDPSCLSEPHMLLADASTQNSISSGRIFNPWWQFTEQLNGVGETFAAARGRADKLVDDIIASRRKMSREAAAAYDDFLSTLLQGTDEVDPVLFRDCIITLLFASKDTTQNALSWSLHELSRHPDWVDAMRNEALSRDTQERAIPYDNLANYPIHMAVLYETLRLWPGVPKNSRVALQDDVLPGIPELGYGPIKVDKGDNVAWSDFEMMKNEAVWGPDAKEFNPARHLDADGQFVKPSQPKFHAFGAGPRACPGSQSATYQFVAIWASILPFFDIKPVEMKDRYWSDGLTISMRDPLLVRLKVDWSTYRLQYSRADEETNGTSLYSGVGAGLSYAVYS